MRFQLWKRTKRSDPRLARLSIDDTQSTDALWRQLSQPHGPERVAEAAGLPVDELIRAVGALTAHECRDMHQRLLRAHLLDLLAALVITALVMLILLDTVLVGTRVFRGFQAKPTLVASHAIRAGEAVNNANTTAGFSRFARVCFRELPPGAVAATVNIQPGRPICDNTVSVVTSGGVSK